MKHVTKAGNFGTDDHYYQSTFVRGRIVRVYNSPSRHYQAMLRDILKRRGWGSVLYPTGIYGYTGYGRLYCNTMHKHTGG